MPFRILSACSPVISPPRTPLTIALTSELFKLILSNSLPPPSMFSNQLSETTCARSMKLAMMFSGLASMESKRAPRKRVAGRSSFTLTMLAATIRACRSFCCVAKCAARSENPPRIALSSSPANSAKTVSMRSSMSFGSVEMCRFASADATVSRALKASARAWPTMKRTPSRKNGFAPRSMIPASTISSSVSCPAATASEAASRPFSSCFSAASFCLRTAIPVTFFPNSSSDRARRSNGAWLSSARFSRCTVACGLSCCCFSFSAITPPPAGRGRQR